MHSGAFGAGLQIVPFEFGGQLPIRFRMFAEGSPGFSANSKKELDHWDANRSGPKGPEIFPK